MKRGYVKWYNDVKGYGFVISDVNGFETSNILLHFTAFREGLFTLSAGDYIEFVLDESTKNLQAKRIRLLK